MKAKFNLLSSTLLGAISFLIVIVLFFLLSAIHEIVEEGNAFGFSIGFSKVEVISNLLNNSEQRIEAINLVSADSKSAKRVNLSTISEYSSSSDKWIVMFESAYFFDSVTLHFCSERLCKIFRKRQYLEVP